MNNQRILAVDPATAGGTNKKNFDILRPALGFIPKVALAMAHLGISGWVIISPAFGVADFSGKWDLDLRASSSPHAMLKRLGASWVELRFGGSIQMEATYTQTPKLLTIDSRGFGFQKTDVIRIDNKPEIQENSLLGQYTIRSFWSENGKQLISVLSFQTKDSRDAQMTIVRELADRGKTLTWSSTLSIAGESGSSTLRRVWRKRDSS